MEDDKNTLARDGGISSRKFWFSVISSVLILIASRVSPVTAIAEVCAAIVMICSIYVAGNTIVKWRAGAIEQSKVLGQLEQPQTPEEPKPEGQPNG